MWFLSEKEERKWEYETRQGKNNIYEWQKEKRFRRKVTAGAEMEETLPPHCRALPPTNTTETRQRWGGKVWRSRGMYNKEYLKWNTTIHGECLHFTALPTLVFLPFPQWKKNSPAHAHRTCLLVNLQPQFLVEWRRRSITQPDEQHDQGWRFLV